MPKSIVEENIPLLERDENINDNGDYLAVKTSFTYDDIIQQEVMESELRRREKNLDRIDTELNAFRASFQREKYLLKSKVDLECLADTSKFPGEYVNISKSNGEFLAESTMRTRLGATLTRRLLSIETSSSVNS